MNVDGYSEEAPLLTKTFLLYIGGLLGFGFLGGALLGGGRLWGGGRITFGGGLIIFAGGGFPGTLIRLAGLRIGIGGRDGGGLLKGLGVEEVEGLEDKLPEADLVTEGEFDLETDRVGEKDVLTEFEVVTDGVEETGHFPNWN